MHLTWQRPDIRIKIREYTNNVVSSLQAILDKISKTEHHHGALNGLKDMIREFHSQAAAMRDVAIRVEPKSILFIGPLNGGKSLLLNFLMMISMPQGYQYARNDLITKKVFIDHPIFEYAGVSSLIERNTILNALSAAQHNDTHGKRKREQIVDTELHVCNLIQY